LIVFLGENDHTDIAQKIINLSIKPGFVSVITYQKNNTESIINSFKNLEKNNIDWKLHNMLEEFDYQESLSIVLNTNPNKDKYQFLWINLASSCDSWEKDISSINYIVTIKQPIAHALYRNQEETDGLFISLKTYEEIKDTVNPDITLALKEIDNPLIKYYA